MSLASHVWIHSFFISRTKTFYRVPNLLWNEVFSETRGFEFIHSSFPERKHSVESSLKLVVIFKLFEGMVGFEYIDSSFPKHKHSPEYPISFEMKSSLKLVAVFELFVRPALDFPGRLGRHWTRFCLRTLWRDGWLSLNPLFVFERRGWSSLNCLTGLQLSGLEFLSSSLRRRAWFNLHFDRQFSSDTQPFKPFTCILAQSILSSFKRKNSKMIQGKFSRQMSHFQFSCCCHMMRRR